MKIVLSCRLLCVYCATEVAVVYLQCVNSDESLLTIVEQQICLNLKKCESQNVFFNSFVVLRLRHLSIIYTLQYAPETFHMHNLLYY